MTSAWDHPDHMMTGINNIGPGWHPLVAELEVSLNELKPDYQLYQVKAKFGGLRYYADGSGPYAATFSSLCRDAEAASFKICEQCGADAENKSDQGWYNTLCDDCRTARREKRE